MTYLLDGNVLAALVIDSHVHHALAKDWFGRSKEPFATCSVTQGTLLRVHMIMAVDKSPAAAWQTLAALERHSRHQFWDDGFGYQHVAHQKLQGPKQVTDAWLAELARRHSAKLVTLDQPLANLHHDVAMMLTPSLSDSQTGEAPPAS